MYPVVSGLLRFARNDVVTETKMTKAAFDKIKAGIDDVHRYPDGSIDKREFPVHTLTDAKVRPTSAQAPPPKEES
jgi:hypothetical protein